MTHWVYDGVSYWTPGISRLHRRLSVRTRVTLGHATWTSRFTPRARFTHVVLLMPGQHGSCLGGDGMRLGHSRAPSIDLSAHGNGELTLEDFTSTDLDATDFGLVM